MQEEYRSVDRRLNSKQRSSLWPKLIFILSLLLAGGCGYFYYTHEYQVNEQVEKLKDQAERKALDGQYEDALADLKEASELRPEYKVLQENQKLVEEALAMEESLEEIAHLLQQQKLKEAKEQIARFTETLEQKTDPVFVPFFDKIDEKSAVLTVAEIKVEIDQLTTVEQLGAKLQTLAIVQADEKEEVQSLILKKIVNVTVKNAEEQLSNYQFTDALAIVDYALQYAEQDSELLALRDRIIEEQSYFQNEKELRLEKAKEIAEQSELQGNATKSKTQIKDLKHKVDKYGDLYISGVVKNISDEVMSSIRLEYSIIDDEGKEIKNSIMYASQLRLEPGETSDFADYQYGINQDVTVTIKKVIWKAE